ncbi:hypothetical protein OG21DRAFT_1194719 [Imleria badia]|nr:hypothetical protein OG21DRAFT_1194719 [Imleria badia]
MLPTSRGHGLSNPSIGADRTGRSLCCSMPRMATTGSTECGASGKHLRELFAEQCETMMQSNPITTKDRFVIAFACYAKLQCLDLLLDSHPQGDLIIGEALRVHAHLDT